MEKQLKKQGVVDITDFLRTLKIAVAKTIPIYRIPFSSLDFPQSLSPFRRFRTLRIRFRFFFFNSGFAVFYRCGNLEIEDFEKSSMQRLVDKVLAVTKEWVVSLFPSPYIYTYIRICLCRFGFLQQHLFFSFFVVRSLRLLMDF